MFTSIDDQFDHIDPDFNLDINSDRCKYYTIDEFNLHFSSDAKAYLLLNQNIQSFNSKQSLLEAFLESITLPFHSIVLTETWNQEKYLNLCEIENFDGVHTYRDVPNHNTHGGPGGGVSIFTNSSIYGIKKVDVLSVCNRTIETCVARIYRKDNTSIDHFIVAIYRPHTDTIENFTNALQEILSNPLLHSKTVIVAGDMNINLLDHNNVHVNQYICMLNSLNYVQTINKVTRFPNGGSPVYNPSCLDHISINKITQHNASIFFADISDHCGTALHFEIDEIPPPCNKKHKISFRLINDENILNFGEIISNCNWDFLKNINDVNEQFIEFQNYINSVYRECFPLKTKLISIKRKNKPWITESTLAKIKLKSTYYKQFKNGIISREVNNRLKNRLNKEINRDKTIYYQTILSNSKGNMKKSWKTLHSLMGSKNNKNSIDNIFSNATSDHDKMIIVNRFNDFLLALETLLLPKFQIPYTHLSFLQIIYNKVFIYFLLPVKK